MIPNLNDILGIAFAHLNTVTDVRVHIQKREHNNGNKAILADLSFDDAQGKVFDMSLNINLPFRPAPCGCPPDPAGDTDNEPQP
jgi:hypothetical protein